MRDKRAPKDVCGEASYSHRDFALCFPSFVFVLWYALLFSSWLIHFVLAYYAVITCHVP